MSEEKRFLDSAGLKKAFELIKQNVAENYIAKGDSVVIADALGYVPVSETAMSEAIGEAKTAVEEQLAADKEELEGKVSELDEKVDQAVEDLEQAIEDKADELEAKIKVNADAIEVLNGDDKTEGSVAKKVADEIAKIVNENNNGDIDTLNEIASWIVNDTTGAASMAADIADLKKAVGEDGSVAEQIEEAVSAEAERAEAKEAELADAVVAEQARAEAKEADLQDQIDAIGRITEAEIIALFNGAKASIIKANGDIVPVNSIVDALAAAEAGEEIVLVENVEIPAGTEIADGVTIVANGRVIVC